MNNTNVTPANKPKNKQYSTKGKGERQFMNPTLYYQFK